MKPERSGFSVWAGGWYHVTREVIFGSGARVAPPSAPASLSNARHIRETELNIDELSAVAYRCHCQNCLLSAKCNKVIRYHCVHDSFHTTLTLIIMNFEYGFQEDIRNSNKGIATVLTRFRITSNEQSMCALNPFHVTTVVSPDSPFCVVVVGSLPVFTGRRSDKKWGSESFRGTVLTGSDGAPNWIFEIRPRDLRLFYLKRTFCKASLSPSSCNLAVTRGR
ncbi:hypothetical protein EVAR_20087_1 [Eumeta japonica]|uniref:Uncharacterized protein n=1 Tax=Eumeta variegata TaxID=151549 RepID=A0A4C1UHY0_EUMVA|nr:hypothetical protein EVAR_20087_1 [Eumeta japonica]